MVHRLEKVLSFFKKIILLYVWLACHKWHIFQLYNFLNFYICIHPQNHPYSQENAYIHYPRSFLCPSFIPHYHPYLPPSPLPSIQAHTDMILGIIDNFSLSRILSKWDRRIFVWLLFILLEKCSFYEYATQMNQYIIHSPVDGHLSFF